MDKEAIVRALSVRGVLVDPLSKRWFVIDEIRKWALTYLPPEARMAKLAESSWLREVEELGGCVPSLLPALL